jgi:acyl-CoA synthetase (AMP-forming)/AMP-acid ligase II
MVSVMRETRPLEDLTLVALLRRRAAQQPNARGYTFLADGELKEISLTYQQLDRQARSIAAMIRAAGANGESVLLVFPSGLDFIAAFFGCLYAGSIAVAAYPPRPNRPMDRFAVIARDSGARVVLTLEGIRSKLEPAVAEVDGFQHLKWLTVDQLDDNAADEWFLPDINEDSLALLQYTSGSTAQPKGTMVSHGNLLHNSRSICTAFGHSRSSVAVGWLPMTHDMGLVGNVLQPLFVGFPIVIMAPEHFLVKPIRWLRAISRYRATTSGGPNFAYDHCSQKIRPELRSELDLSSWQLAFNGAEIIRPATLDRFSAEFAQCGFQPEAFHPCYGLAESTLIVTSGPGDATPVRKAFDAVALGAKRAVQVVDDADNSRTLVACGRTYLEQEVVIVDPDTCRRCPDGHIGEIWVAGRSVAQGYHNKPRETKQVFQGYLNDSGDGPFLTSGDLGFINDGDLFISGRLKDLLIIGGVNHYPTDIEVSVEHCHAAIRENCVAAVSVDVDGGERLVIVAEIDRHHLAEDKAQPKEDIIAAIRGAISLRHDLSAHAICLIRQSTTPRTSSGKIQRHACRNQFLQGGLSLV